MEKITGIYDAVNTIRQTSNVKIRVKLKIPNSTDIMYSLFEERNRFSDIIILGRNINLSTYKF